MKQTMNELEMANVQEPQNPAAPSLANTFNAIYSAKPSSVMEQIWRDVYGDDYPPSEVQAFSFISRSELERIARELKLSANQTMADLACGGGGPGLWVARELDACLIGVDISSVAVAQAKERAKQFGWSDKANFRVGDFAATGLEDASLDGAMSVDAFWLTFDKMAALQEVARVLRVGARFVCTTWESEIPIPNFPPQVQDHQPLLHAAGFQVEHCDELPNWEKHQRGVYEGILARQGELIQERGPHDASFMINEAAFVTGLVDGTDYLERSRRVLVVARRK